MTSLRPIIPYFSPDGLRRRFNFQAMKLHFVVLNRYRSAFLTICFLTHPLSAAENPWVGNTLNGIPCTGGLVATNPYDYTNPVHREKVRMVEANHFTSNVERFISGKSTTNIGGDIDFTLRAIPNHYRALQAMTRYQERAKRGEGAKLTPVECYFQRAINFNSYDGNVHLQYAVYLHKKGRHSTALQYYESARKLAPKNTAIHYNIALLYIDLKKYKQAHQHAVKAYQGGYPLPGLKNRLIKLGYWKIPPN